jgi:hypothetical protein
VSIARLVRFLRGNGRNRVSVLGVAERMTRMKMAAALLGALALLGGCAEDPPALAGGSAIEVVRTGGDMMISDTLVVSPDGSWKYTDNSGKRRSADGRLSVEKTAAAWAIVRRPAFAAEIAVPKWDARCIDPPDVTIKVDGKQSVFTSCDDPRQQNMNDLLQLLLEEIYNKNET